MANINSKKELEKELEKLKPEEITNDPYVESIIKKLRSKRTKEEQENKDASKDASQGNVGSENEAAKSKSKNISNADLIEKQRRKFEVGW